MLRRMDRFSLMSSLFNGTEITIPLHEGLYDPNGCKVSGVVIAIELDEVGSVKTHIIRFLVRGTDSPRVLRVRV